MSHLQFCKKYPFTVYNYWRGKRLFKNKKVNFFQYMKSVCKTVQIDLKMINLFYDVSMKKYGTKEFFIDWNNMILERK